MERINTITTEEDCANAFKTCEALPAGDGLYLWVGKRGNKSWRYREVTKGAKIHQRIFTLGKWPEMSLEAAHAAMQRRQVCAQERKEKIPMRPFSYIANVAAKAGIIDRDEIVEVPTGLLVALERFARLVKVPK